MSILSEIGAFLMGISASTLNFIKGIVVMLASNPQVQAIATAEVQKAEDAAIAAVQSGSVMTGVEKFTAAQTGVVQQLTEAGLPVIMNAVNLAIEGAVANLKAPAVPVGA